MQQPCSNPDRVHELLLAASKASTEGILGLTRAYRGFLKEHLELYAATVRSYRLSNSDDPQSAQAEGQSF